MATESSTIVQRLWNYCNVLRDESLEDSANLPDPDILAREIMEELESGLEQFAGIVDELNGSEDSKIYPRPLPTDHW